MEQNIDAYRIMAEILRDFRALFQQTLETVYGDQWSTLGIPPKTRENLAAQREIERAIDWFDSEHHELMVYATFDDFLDILQVDDSFFPAVTALAPSQPLLYTRFLELEVMRKKLGRARAISEAELSFLGSFHMRFRKSLAATLENGPEITAMMAKKPESVIDEDEDNHDEPIIQDVQSDQNEPVDVPIDVPIDESIADEIPEEDPVDQNATMAIEIPADEAEVVQVDTEEVQIIEAEETRTDPTVPDETEQQDTESKKADSADTQKAPIAGASLNLTTALEEQDSKFILKQLYTEITSTAEAMWSTDHPVMPTVWEIVRVSRWYESQFSSLGLKPVSDFYEIIGNFHERVERGESTKELQHFLKDCNFAHVLLSLRDMFQRMQVY